MSDESMDHSGHSVQEKLLQDELIAERAKIAVLMQRLSAAHGAPHVEQVAHDRTKAELERVRKVMTMTLMTSSSGGSGGGGGRLA